MPQRDLGKVVLGARHVPTLLVLAYCGSNQIADSLIRLPFVVGWPFDNYDASMREFSRVFYSNLRDYPVRDSFTLATMSTGSDRLANGGPRLLGKRTSDVRLFSRL